MSALDLDRATLRWVADELERDKRTRMELYLRHRDERYVAHADILAGHARRLRARATRIERKRGRS